MPKFQKNTVQHTLCMPLCGRMIAARKYPELFPDRDSECIVRELGEDLSGKALYRLQYMWMNCLITFHMSFMLHVEFRAVSEKRLIGCLAGKESDFQK